MVVKLFDYCEFFSDYLGVQVYPLQYPFNTEREDCFTLDVVFGYTLADDVKSTQVQFQCRSLHPQTAEEKAEELILKLKDLTNVIYGDYQIIRIKPSFTNPYFMGQDENGNYLFTVDFIILTNKINR